MANNGFMHLSKYKARYGLIQASQVTLVVKNPPANAGDLKRHGFDPWEDPLEEGMAVHSSVLA